MRRPLAALALAALIAGRAPNAHAAAESDTSAYASTVADVNRVGVTVSNYGFFGNNFVSRSPSFEFPLGSGFEHMSRAGLWIGAHALADTGAFTGVSTAILDDAQGSNALAGTEFTPRGTGLVRLSRIENSRYFSREAVSDQDLSGEYRDTPGRTAAGVRGERHTPLRVRVRQQSLGFTLPAADAFVVVRFTIVNEGPPLRGAWVGLYAQLASGLKTAYSSWPPSAGGGPGSWYYRARGDYDSTRAMYTEHYCASSVNYPTRCGEVYSPDWAAVKFLRALPAGPRETTFHWWSYSPGDTLRDTDVERYAILAENVREDPSACPQDGTCSPITLLGVGPFDTIAPGDSVEVDFAFVGGENQALLQKHADYAQFAASIDYHLPSPPPSPRLHVETGESRVDLWWDDSPESVVDPASHVTGGKDFEGYRVYLGLDRANPLRYRELDLVDTLGYNTGLDSVRLATPRVIDGVTYRYHLRIPGLKNGFRYWGAVTSFDTGDDATESLESGLSQNKFLAVPAPAPGERHGVTVFPNPYRVEALWDHGQQVRQHYLWFAGLPPRCELRIYTLGGDLVFHTHLEGGTPSGPLARGVYDPARDRDTAAPALSGASFAWDLITDRGQATATGLYLWSVEDSNSGRFERGKFLVVKSDRE